ncbi:hypothetical protein OG884_18850 [Streptosporangium sp. NBC_01755]|uniref:hypothetical protein n=1 Tax=Streptosporangium sp. NBC_01755 TaxID=2975949 RepID=UPI002DDC3BAC|nr:hypothetical protein [Streptosporangium sp. NBC_01755]WSD03868.1 hypothetical protein OG884_18850 [Streptosporangium sp. NBC_01755]
MTTIYHRGEQERVTHSETMSEPEWTDEDVAWHMAYLRWKADQCHNCGLQLSETTEMRDGEPVRSYIVPNPSRCHACTALARAQEKHSKYKTEHPQALFWFAVEDD